MYNDIHEKPIGRLYPPLSRVSRKRGRAFFPQTNFHRNFHTYLPPPSPRWPLLFCINNNCTLRVRCGCGESHRVHTRLGTANTWDYYYVRQHTHAHIVTSASAPPVRRNIYTLTRVNAHTHTHTHTINPRRQGFHCTHINDTVVADGRCSCYGLGATTAHYIVIAVRLSVYICRNFTITTTTPPSNLSTYIPNIGLGFRLSLFNFYHMVIG